jgi:hypothetical protein
MSVGQNESGTIKPEPLPPISRTLDYRGSHQENTSALSNLIALDKTN